jgi:hypothetical protein
MASCHKHTYINVPQADIIINTSDYAVFKVPQKNNVQNHTDENDIYLLYICAMTTHSRNAMNIAENAAAYQSKIWNRYMPPCAIDKNTNKWNCQLSLIVFKCSYNALQYLNSL